MASTAIGINGNAARRSWPGPRGTPRESFCARLVAVNRALFYPFATPSNVDFSVYYSILGSPLAPDESETVSVASPAPLW